MRTQAIEALIPEALLDAPREAVQAGRYASLDAVLAEALLLWHQRLNEDAATEILRQTGDEERATARLRALYEEGKASGTAGPLDIETLLAELHADDEPTRRRA